MLFYTLTGIAIYLLIQGKLLYALILGLTALSFKRPRRPARVERIAREQGVRIPRNLGARKKLRELYDHYQYTSKAYPSLKPQYDGIIESLWSTLRTVSTPSEWVKVVEQVRKQWPVPGQSDIWSKMQEAKTAADNWNESIREANLKDWKLS